MEESNICIRVLGYDIEAIAVYRIAAEQVGKKRSLHIKVRPMRKKCSAKCDAILLSPKHARDTKRFGYKPVKVTDINSCGTPSDRIKIACQDITDVCDEVLIRNNFTCSTWYQN